ncbi:MAG TPA: methyltransferase domain-containing protein [Gaiellaceae bacterium]
MTTAREIYELWASGSEHDLSGASEPRSREWLFELFASLGPQPGEMIIDVGARDGRHLRRLVEEHGLRGIGLDPVPTGPDVVEGSIEELPLDDATVDWIWCRDVLVHTDVERGLAECARVLRPGGRMIAYASVAGSLEPREAGWLSAAVALATLDGARIERAAANAGLTLEQKHEIGSEWRERMIEDGEWDANEALLQFARMRRLRLDASADAVDYAWGVYQVLGKLCPTVYVWGRRG